MITVTRRSLSRNVKSISLLCGMMTFLVRSISNRVIAKTDSIIRLKRISAQVVHRHGDRSPITPVVDEAYWFGQLIPESTATKIASNTAIVPEGDAFVHPAQGRGPFGKLSQLGLFQMIELGTKLRNDLFGLTASNNSLVDEHGRLFFPYLLTKRKGLLQYSDVRVISTNFQRTIQSVQGLLVGLFPDAAKDELGQTKIEIDVRYTNIMIPDPKPRRTLEQEKLEEELVQRPLVVERDLQLTPLANRVSAALHPLLASDAHAAAFGTPQKMIEDHPSQQSIETVPLSWNQLAELCVCLRSRNLLPSGIELEDVETIVQHAAWKWFQSWKHPRLAYLSMNPLVTKQLGLMDQYILYYEKNKLTKMHVDSADNFESESPPGLTIWSAHDSTLIGLMCAYRLEQPDQWPEYGSFLLIELLERDDGNDRVAAGTSNYYVRFSLNGKVLKSKWEDDDEPAVEMIPIDRLRRKIRDVGADQSDLRTSNQERTSVSLEL